MTDIKEEILGQILDEKKALYGTNIQIPVKEAEIKKLAEALKESSENFAKAKVKPSAIVKKVKSPAPEAVLEAAVVPDTEPKKSGSLAVNSDLPMSGREHQTAIVFDIRRGILPNYGNRIERLIQSINGNNIKAHFYTLGGNKAGTGAALAKKTPNNYTPPNVPAQSIDLEQWGKDMGFTMLCIVIPTGT